MLGLDSNRLCNRLPRAVLALCFSCSYCSFSCLDSWPTLPWATCMVWELRSESCFLMLSPSELSQLRAAAANHIEAVAELAQRICEIPAPTGNEQARAQLVASLWRQRGYTPEIDAISNVDARRGKRGNGPVLLLLAHTDTVFPQATPISIERDADILRGPSIGDNSLSVAAMISTLDILDELGRETDADIVAVADVGEEGLGNLLGARTAVERYPDNLGAVTPIPPNLRT